MKCPLLRAIALHTHSHLMARGVRAAQAEKLTPLLTQHVLRVGLGKGEWLRRAHDR
jgi:hypothetical protein